MWERAASQAFSTDMGACGPRCLGSKVCTVQCVGQRHPGLSPACLEAYGEIAQCTARRCWAVCASGTHAQCGACGVRCNPRFFETTGFTRWENPRAGLDVDIGAEAEPAEAEGSAPAYGAALVLLMILLPFLLCLGRYGWKRRRRHALEQAETTERSRVGPLPREASPSSELANGDPVAPRGGGLADAVGSANAGLFQHPAVEREPSERGRSESESST